MLSKASVKYIQSLQHKKFRDETGCFVAEGPKVVRELIESRIFNCTGVYALQEWIDAENKSLFEPLDNKVFVITEPELKKISSLTTPNMVLAVFNQKKPEEKFSLKGNVTLVLDDIQDPGNLGTIIRTADWFGIKNIVCSFHTVDMYNFKVVQSTMSSLARVNMIYTDLENWLSENHTVKILAAVLDGKNLDEMKEMKECIVLIGNESKGLSEKLIDMADEKITIRRIGEAESLNAAVANAIILHHLSMLK